MRFVFSVRCLLFQSDDAIFGHGKFQGFCIMNLFAINVCLAFIEILFLSSIKRMEVRTTRSYAPILIHD
jgi:hypothetical protein